MKIVGYSDRFSVRPGQTSRFMVSSAAPTYRAEIVRLRHTDANPKGPGFKCETLQTSVDGEYPGRHQAIHSGSYAAVPHHTALNCPHGFTLQAWIYPTTPQKGVQGLLTKFSGKSGYGLYIDEDGSLALWVGADERLEKVRTGVALQAAQWYYVAASYDAATGEVCLYQKLQSNWPVTGAETAVRETVLSLAVGENQEDLLMAASRNHSASAPAATHHFNGKIDNPRLYDRALAPPDATDSDTLIANWDFSLDIDSDKVRDTQPNELHGRTVNLPTRAVTGHNWTGDEANFKAARAQYGAIHFHDDDLEDAQWQVAFEWTPPNDWPSGAYAAHLTTADAEDYLPFIVVPKTARARIAFLAPTLTYLVYANQHFNDPIREIDRVDRALGTPDHALLLATAEGFTDLYQVAIEDQLVSAPNTGGSQNPLVRSDMVYFEGPKGGAVFPVGSISWCSCLSYNGADNNVSRITENVLRRFASDTSERD